MNTKTTITLALLLLLGVAGLYFIKTRQPAAAPALPPEPSQAATKKVFDEDLGEIVKVTVVKGGGEPLVFEKKKEGDSASGPTWHVTAPFEAKANTWEIDRIPRDMAQLSYEISYEPGESGGVTPEQAGLAPPTAVITLTNVEGKEATIAVGKPASQSETYVRVAGDDAVLVAKSRVGDLIKKSPAEYRDAQVWSFEPANVKRVEIVDRTSPAASGTAEPGANNNSGAGASGAGVSGAGGSGATGGLPASASPTRYVFVRDGDKWMMESPVTARATIKVDDALKTVSKLRVLKWEPQAQVRAAGLDPAAVTATFTVEEKVPVDKPAEAEPKDSSEGEEAPPEPSTETKTSQYTLHISSASPIGEDTKTYVRVGDETAVATIMKTVADKIKPVMNEWREMRLVTDDVQKSSKIELMAAGESATLSKTGEDWQFEGGGKAEAAEIAKLLDAVGKLEAVVFMEGEGQAGEYAFDNPRATIALTIPGVEGTRRLTIGGYTDPQTKRMSYVRRDDANTVAKVLEAELAPLLRAPSTYQDRTILSIAPADVARFSLSRQNPFTNSQETIALEMAEGTWRMTEPIAAEARQAEVQELLDALTSLKAERVVPQSETASMATEFEQPGAQLTIIHQKPASAGEGPEVETPGEKITVTLAIAEVNGKNYAKLAEASTLYELPAAFSEKLRAEYREGTVLTFNPSEVTKFTLKDPTGSHTFRRQNDKWVYDTEPDLPLDQAKVEALLAPFQNLQTDRFAVHAEADPASYGLTEPEHELRLAVGDKESTLAVSAMSSQAPAAKGRFGQCSQTPGVFLIPEASVQQMRVNLDSLSAS